jgi:hypothetical protein
VVADPLWDTFVSSNAGVWRGVGAAFSPITAEMEPMSLGSKNEYLYDAQVLCTVEPIPRVEGEGRRHSTLHRKILWTVENPHGEKGFDDEIQLQSELLDDEGTNEFEGDAGNQLAIDGSELINFKGVDFSDVIEGVEEEEEEDLHEDGHSEENSEASSQETPIAEYSRNGLHSSVLTGEEAPIPEEHVSRSESISQSSVEGTMLLTDSLLDVHTMNDRPATSSQSDRNAESGDIVWKDVMEEDDMGMEPGLVFFSVG